MSKAKGIRLKYLPADETDDSADAQPCTITSFNGKHIRVVPITPIGLHDCGECVGTGNLGLAECGNIPDCSNAIYVRATPANKVKHIAWLIDNYDKRN